MLTYRSQANVQLCFVKKKISSNSDQNGGDGGGVLFCLFTAISSMNLLSPSVSLCVSLWHCIFQQYSLSFFPYNWLLKSWEIYRKQAWFLKRLETRFFFFPHRKGYTSIPYWSQVFLEFLKIQANFFFFVYLRKNNWLSFFLTLPQFYKFFTTIFCVEWTFHHNSLTWKL